MSKLSLEEMARRRRENVAQGKEWSDPIEPEPEIRAVTSASNFYRRRLCIGSGIEEAKYGPEPDTEYSEEGRLLHRYFLTLPQSWPKDLTAPQREALASANHYAGKFIEDVLNQEGVDEDTYRETAREVGLLFFGPGGKGDASGEPLMPGHADIITTFPEYGFRFVIDAKFGVTDVDDAPDNDQLAIYACMAQQIQPMIRTHVAIIQPRNFGPRMSSAVYTAEGIVAATEAITKDFLRSVKGGQLTAGKKQCHFCRAKVACPAYRQKFYAVYSPGAQAIETIENDKLIEVHEACAFAAKIGKQVSEEMRKRIDDGRITTHKLQNSGDDREVINPTGMYHAFKTNFEGNPKWNATRYDECRQIAWGKLEDYVRELTGLPEKRAKEIVTELSAPFVKATPKAKRVVRIK